MAGNHNSGRKPKYLTVERFEGFLGNDFAHLIKDVKLNRRLLLGILLTVVALPTIFFVTIIQLVV